MRSDFYNETQELNYILSEMDRIGAFCGLSSADAGKLRLLAEEMLCLTVRLFDRVRYTFYVENEGRRFSLRLTAKAPVSFEQKDKILSLSTEGGNIAAKGALGKLRGVFESLLMGDYEAASIICPYETAMGGTIYFSMASYRSALTAAKKEELWDGLEKSIIANLAEDVTIGVKSNEVEIVAVIEFTN